MLNNKEYNQAENLSQCLDDFYGSYHSMTQDEEINELVEMANVVKQSYSQGNVPQVWVSELVDHLTVELKAQKQQRKRTHWLYGGLVGVAAVFIAAFVQFLVPQSAVNNIAQQSEQSKTVGKDVGVADQSSDLIVSYSTNDMIRQPVESGSSIQAPVGQSVDKKSGNDLSKVVTEIIQVTKSPEITQIPSQVAILQHEELKNMMRTRGLLMAKADYDVLGEGHNSPLDHKLAIMVIPNQTTQSIIVDDTSGVIKQIYNPGTNDELIMTLRPRDDTTIKMKGDARQGKVQGVAKSPVIRAIKKDTEKSMNSLTVKVDEYDITIEGKKSMEDLQKIADSLTGMKKVQF